MVCQDFICDSVSPDDSFVDFSAAPLGTRLGWYVERV